MTPAYLIGFIVGMAVIFVFALVISRLLRGKWGFCSQYDERQKIAQGKCYRDAFWAMVIYLFLWYLLVYTFELPLPSTQYLLLGSFFFGILVYAVSCIFRDAYIGLQDRPKAWCISTAVILVINLLCALMNYREGNNDSFYLNLICTVMLAIVLGAFGLHALLRSQNEGDDEE